MTSPTRFLLASGCLAVVLSPLFAMGGEPFSPRTRKVEKPTVIDLLLGREGTLEGQFRDAGELLADGATVSIWEGHKLIWQGTPDEAGKFQLKNVKSGLYRVVYGSQSVICRAWTDETAPPQAKGALILNREKRRDAHDGSSFRFLPAGALFPPIWSGTHSESRLPSRP
ncbi:MAG TPA: hypothetical protein VNQ76_01685 [Planctomicrobium sp.]|nr:hypothetical protein [Planctomicrobium sp.]